MSESTTHEEIAGDTATPTVITKPRRTKRASNAAAFDTIERAAEKLDVDPNALRARCRRAAVKVGDSVQAHLGGGIVAFKFGRSWRIRFPSP